jgi:hypothetical protein
MNKVIFQLGLLAFCVASVLFGIQDMSLLEVIARAFLVFVIVVCAIAAILMVASSFARKPEPEVEQPAHDVKAGTRGPAEAAAK